MKEKPNYYAIITAEVRYCEELSSSQKLFFAEITALSQKFGKCWASNSYFADLYGVARSTITSWINALQEQGFISVSYEKDGKQIKKRTIVITDNKRMEGIQNIEQGCSENTGRGDQKIKGGCSENPKENNTSNNNTRVNKSAGGVSDDKLHPLQQFVRDELPEVAKLDKQLCFDNCKSLIEDFGKSLVHDVLLAMENHSQLTNKYKSVYLTARNWCKHRGQNKNMNQADSEIAGSNAYSNDYTEV